MMKITWYVDDGYVNPGPHYITIDDEELAECKTEEAKDEIIEQCVREEFMDKVSFYWERG